MDDSGLREKAEEVFFHQSSIGEMTDRILAMVDAEYRPGWVSVKERLPTNGQRVCYYFKPVGVHAGHYERNGTSNVFFSGRGFLTDDVTHWMPLPEPPKEVP